MTSTRNVDLIKVLFHLEPDQWHGSATETLWAEPAGEGVYRLQNTPFLAYGVSFLDEVEAQPHEPGGVHVYQRTRVPSGHSTYRAILLQTFDAAPVRSLLATLNRLGCTYETGHGKIVALDVPGDADVFAVYKVLERGETEGAWDFEEGHCGHSV